MLPSVLDGPSNGDQFMAQFRAGITEATPLDMAAAVSEACEYIERMRPQKQETSDRINNATYTACQITTILAGRLAATEEQREEYADNRLHAKAKELYRRVDEILANEHLDRRTAELMAGVTKAAALAVEPYENRDGKLYRKTDGVLVDWLED
jgi:hypothetical protein